MARLKIGKKPAVGDYRYSDLPAGEIKMTKKWALKVRAACERGEAVQSNVLIASIMKLFDLSAKEAAAMVVRQVRPGKKSKKDKP
jgi:hypothetical protein